MKIKTTKIIAIVISAITVSAVLAGCGTDENYDIQVTPDVSLQNGLSNGNPAAGEESRETGTAAETKTEVSEINETVPATEKETTDTADTTAAPENSNAPVNAATQPETLIQTEQETAAKPEQPEVSETKAADQPVSASSPEPFYAEGGVLVVNKTYPLPSDYVPDDLVKIGWDDEVGYVTSETGEAFKKMQADAYEEGLNLYLASGYRSYSLQSNLYNRYVSRDGKEAADKYSARPGYSEHQSGLAFDLNSIDESFAYTDEGKWVAEHCHEYGFIIRYPADKEDKTGYMYEPWHLRYLGVGLATDIHDTGLCLEEYFGLTSEYAD